jgi:hypothetical protein
VPAARPAVAILLPPSEGKAEGGTEPLWTPELGRFGAQLGECRAVVAGALGCAMGDEAGAAKLLGVGGHHLDRARTVGGAVIGAPTLPAAQRYTGVVWSHLDLASIKRPKGFVLVMSGLLGLIAADDPVPDYRLKMGARLGELGTLARWWRPHLTAAITEAVGTSEVLDLLPNEHSAAWEPLPRRWCVRFETVRQDDMAHTADGPVGGGGPGRAIGHEAKAVKGLLARHVLTTGGSLGARLRSFEAPGWQLDRVEPAGAGGMPRTAVVVQVP